MRIRIVTEGASNRSNEKGLPVRTGRPSLSQRNGSYRIPATSRARSRSAFCW